MCGASRALARGKQLVRHAHGEDLAGEFGMTSAPRLLPLLSGLLLACQPSPSRNDSAAVLDDLQADAADPYTAARLRMVEEQLRARGIREMRVLDAMARVPRHLFMPPTARYAAYADHPMPIGFNQTISQPYIVAYMTEAAGITPRHKVLEVGTGSGYQAAILAELARDVYTIEIIPELAARSGTLLRDLGYTNVHTRTGDGYAGWPDAAPFDAIIVTAAPDHVPQALVDQLALNGRMIIPVGAGEQEMRVITKTAEGVVHRTTMLVRFVPLVRGDTTRR
jgi:protein-L-isoaspartate(D-aspartate) O-methyltransferase